MDVEGWTRRVDLCRSCVTVVDAFDEGSWVFCCVATAVACCCGCARLLLWLCSYVLIRCLQFLRVVEVESCWISGIRAKRQPKCSFAPDDTTTMSKNEPSIVDFLKAIRVDSSFENRTKLFHLYFPGKKYSGSYEQNVTLLKIVKSLKFSSGFWEHFWEYLGQLVGTPNFGPYKLYMSDKNPEICTEFSTLLFMAYSDPSHDFDFGQGRAIGLGSLAEHKQNCPKCKNHPLLQQ